MAYDWEATDIVRGRIVTFPGSGERCIVGYDPRRNEDNLLLCSQTDGMVRVAGQSRAGLVSYLIEAMAIPAAA